MGGYTSPRSAIADVGVLLALLAPLAVVLVPAHWTSIWMDREFQGWMIAISNRLGTGPPLYADGMHSPMPPLPFALEYLVGGGGGTWLTESALNFAFQALMLFGMYAALSACARFPVPLCATLAAVPVVLALHKVALHDSMAQALAAWATMTMVRGLAPGTSDSRARWWFRSAAMLNAMCLLSKQSTALGLTVGIVAAHLVTSPHRPARRVARAAAHLGSALGFAAVLALALSPLLSLPGLLTDVFLFGAEPKGGPGEAVRNLGRFVRQALPKVLIYGPVAIGLAWLAARARAPEQPAALDGARAFALASVITAVAVLFVELVPTPIDLWGWYASLSWIGYHAGSHVLWTGLCLGLVGAAWGLRRGTVPREDVPWAAMVVILLPTALAHNLSTRHLRWTYDNNPLVVVAMAWFAREALRALRRTGARSRHVTHVALGVFMQLGAWLGLHPQLATARQCTRSWPEVAHLRGARLQPRAEGMRQLVHTVRALTAPDDRVLLLPEDPNVHAWLERPRPDLTSAIVFADQYWDRFVDEDLRRLVDAPPRAIVVGPRAFAPTFARLFGQRGWGVERLSDRIATELLPRAYVLHSSQVIAFQGGTDRMDVYLRRGPP